jgi:Zn-dependent peptidase ImmA (M78 family)
LAKRGFKSWCEKVSGETRTQLGLLPTSPLPALSVAEKHGISVLSVNSIPGISEWCLKQLTELDPWSWSAATIFHKEKKLIITNSAHPPGRQSGNIMHELSHIICDHEAAKTEFLPNGLMMLKNYDADQEEEADLLSATLLLPRVALVHIMASGMSIEAAAEKYVVSVELLKMRLQRAGVYIQFKRRRA